MSVTEEMIDAVLARKQTIDIGGFLYGTRHVIRDHEEERKRQDTVVLWELVTDDYEAGHAAATAQFERIYTRRLLEAALSAEMKVEPSAPQCGLSNPLSADCANMREVGGGFDGERYRCEVCGKSYFLDYEEMK